jgi:hypothetical protein
MTWPNDSSSGMQADYTREGRCAECDVPFGAMHMEACRFDGICGREDNPGGEETTSRRPRRRR